MGEIFRSYWLPAMLAERLPEPDGAPVAIKLLGERLVAFRDTEGRVGLLDEFCPHRRVSLLYGRNEECGLRCVYHGWKFDVEGRVVDTPTELNPDFGKTIEVTAYPTHEAGGIVWTYMGREPVPPPFPDFLFTRLPASHVLGYHYRQECNYLQGLEADIDISHPSFLHSPIGEAPIDKTREAMGVDPRPRGFTRDEAFGFQTIWRWNTPDPAKALYWVDPFVVPCHTIVPAGRTKLRYIWHAWVPIDDEHHWLYYVHYDPDTPADEEERRTLEYNFGQRPDRSRDRVPLARQSREHASARPRTAETRELLRHPRHRRAGCRDPAEHGADRRPQPRADRFPRRPGDAFAPLPAGSGPQADGRRDIARARRDGRLPGTSTAEW